MGLNFGEPNPAKLETPLFANQSLTMRYLLITVLVCVPLMLYVKPIYEYSQIKKHCAHDKKTLRDDN